MSANLKPRLSDDQDAEIARYRAVSGLGVAGLFFGLLSPVAMIAPLLWIVPLWGIFLCGLALWQISQNAPALTGRKAALLGLIFSLLFGAAAPTSWLSYRWVIRREARRFAGQWFEFLRDDQPHKAYQLTLHPKSRQPLDDKTLKGFYRQGSRGREELDNYASQRLIRTLRALGKKAQVRYYQTDDQGHAGERDVVYQTYAVTYEDRQAGKKKTFFVSLKMDRLKVNTGQAEWQLSGAEGGFKPEGL